MKKKKKLDTEENKKSNENKGIELVEKVEDDEDVEKVEDDEDEDEELEEEEEDKVSEPQLFVDSDNDFESKDEAFENMDAGGKKKTNSKNNFESIVEDGLNKSIQNASNKK